VVAYTASQLLPYAEDGDRVCDAPSILQELAETVELRLGSLEDTYDTLALRSAGKMKTTPQPAYVPFDVTNFDQVDFDIGNIIDLDIDQEALRLHPLGVGDPMETWAHGSYYGSTGSGVITDLMGIGISNPGAAVQSDQREDATFNLGHVTYLFDLGPGTLEPRCYTYVTPTTAGATPATVNLFTAEQWAYKIGDLS
jgi:hypothetical protein